MGFSGQRLVEVMNGRLTFCNATSNVASLTVPLVLGLHSEPRLVRVYARNFDQFASSSSSIASAMKPSVNNEVPNDFKLCPSPIGARNVLTGTIVAYRQEWALLLLGDTSYSTALYYVLSGRLGKTFPRNGIRHFYVVIPGAIEFTRSSGPGFLVGKAALDGDPGSFGSTGFWRDRCSHRFSVSALSELPSRHVYNDLPPVASSVASSDPAWTVYF
ncbi:hypothetical protein EV421DRAFT_1729778 [Armillaria borealis]|uniref:Uncharacterized protein n=1 Tax=Armillaria borealis TaxID=47425 RepID=A0AA39K9D9_9AGAR|nr:hypothetical protein EV421DRAFT_1729778 [Armillaria borealis]